jgi:ribonucleotide reductase alpha subunit
LGSRETCYFFLSRTCKTKVLQYLRMVKKKTNQFVVRKRDGRLQLFNKAKLTKALQQSFHAARAGNGYLSKQIASLTEERLKSEYQKVIPGSEDILRIVHEALMEKGFVDVANAYILFFQSTAKREYIKEFFGVRDDLHLGMSAMSLLVDRYLLRNEKGEVIETPSMLFRRVARVVAAIDKRHGKTKREIDQTEEWFYDIMANKAFLPNTSLFLRAGLSKKQQTNRVCLKKEKVSVNLSAFAEQVVSKDGCCNELQTICIADSFMKSVKEKKTIRLQDSVTGKTKRTESTKTLFDQLAKCLKASDRSSLLFIQAAKRKNPICLPEQGVPNTLKKQGQCVYFDEMNYGSINLAAFLKGIPTKGSVDWGLLRQVVQGAVRFLDNAIDVQCYATTQEKKFAKEYRSIGLGVVGFAELLVHIGVAYDSASAIREAERVMRFISKEAKRSSEQLALKRGVYKKYPLGKGKKMKMRNASLTAIHSSKEIALLTNVTPGIGSFHDVSAFRESLSGAELLKFSAAFEKTARHFGFWDSHLLHQIAHTGSVQGVDKISKRIQKLFKTSVEISPRKQIALQATFDKCVDGIVEQRIIVPESFSEKEIQKLIILAWESRCKTLRICFVDSDQ